MMKNILLYIAKYRLQLLFLLIVSLVLHSCANMASPQGGDFDFDPPKLVRTIPEINATNVSKNRIELVFDELIQLDKPSEKIIVTPPQKRNPNIRAISNKIIVELRDSLLPNTTYTVDFTDAIVDNNEGNPFENFSFSFSTGNVVDTLAISGKVLAANNLEPIKGIYVGLHNDLSDSAFITKPFDRISRTNDKGEFTIRGIAEGKYLVYALDDINRTYKYENKSNAIAFYDSIVVPYSEPAFRSDTVFNFKKMTVDTVLTVPYTRFLPDDIVLRSFTSSFRRHYLQKSERPVSDQLKIYFGATTGLPEVTPLNFPSTSKWSLLERSASSDTLIYWIVDTEIAKLDTLLLQVKYNKTDSLDNLVSTIDTLRFIDRTKKKDDVKKKKNETLEFLQLQSNLKSLMDINDTVRLTFSQPVLDFDESKIKLRRMVDSVYVDTDFKLIQDQRNPRKFSMVHKWDYGAEYSLSADSASIFSYSGLWNNKIDNKFKVKNSDEYGDLYVAILGLDDKATAFVQLLDASDKVVRQEKVIYRKNQGELAALFMRLMPGKYYARIVVDENKNGVWDTGDFYEKRQPEMVYYYNSFFEIKANWQKSEQWVIDAIALDKQKPLDITKNKPQGKETKRKKLEREEAEKNKNKQSENQIDNSQINRTAY